MQLTNTIATEPASSRTQALAPAAFAILFGLFLIFGAGFLQSNMAHSAAHDGRHSFSFPCH